MKIKLKGYGVTEIQELKNLDEIKESGLYAVSGYNHAVSVERVTPYGEAVLGEEYDEMVFFTGDDGERYYALETGINFLDKEEK